MSNNVLIQCLQAAVGPVILISGVGLLLLSMTNRYGRIIDRSRALAEALRHAKETDRPRYEAQLKVLLRRGNLARAAITLATISILLVAVLVISLFIMAYFGFQIFGFIAAMFITCLLSLIASILFFLGEINSSLKALKLEIQSLEASVFSAASDRDSA